MIEILPYRPVGGHCPELFECPPHHPGCPGCLGPDRPCPLPFCHLEGLPLAQREASGTSLWPAYLHRCPPAYLLVRISVSRHGRSRRILVIQGGPCPFPRPTVPVTRASVISPRIVMAWRGEGQAPGSSGNKEGQGPSHLRWRLGAVSCLLLSPSPAPAVPPGKKNRDWIFSCSHSTPASKALECSLGLEGPDLS